MIGISKRTQWILKKRSQIQMISIEKIHKTYLKFFSDHIKWINIIVSSIGKNSCAMLR